MMHFIRSRIILFFFYIFNTSIYIRRIYIYALINTYSYYFKLLYYNEKNTDFD